MVELRSSFLAAMAAMIVGLGAAGCSEVGDAVIGPKVTGPITTVAAPEGPYVPADVEDPTVREAAGAAVARIDRGAALTRIFSAEATAESGEFIRMQIELTDQSIWEAVVERADRGFEVLRLERVG